ncbi:uncharacterized protein N7482_010182 [Penicillium canariense]|uniref:Uncharacterized protein n=1 Tax=Penicillium canariense TaxID=189055 RepID=A0A9W9HLA3_9EURO|nr:uncharacterized protein N7482_010182 [Penicillium canariense]KAJ5150930.1 hypothetical protein N7482_010182 [Penicillium canariense]
MSTRTPVSISPPTDAFAAYSQDISRAIMTSRSKPTKLSDSLVDGMPPAPPPSPVSFAIDSNGGKRGAKRSKIPSLSLE